MGKARTEHDQKDTSTFLRNIETGVIADGNVDVDRSVEIGTLASKTNLKVDGDEISVHLQLVFQRILPAASGMFPDLSEIFRYELCHSIYKLRMRT